VYSSDRGFFNEENLETCRTAGVILTCIPQAGRKRSSEREAKEKSRAFKRGQRYALASKAAFPCCSVDAA
jgi:hypothetical protein